MRRRIHVRHVRPGLLPLDAAQAHHARDVLRLPDGAAVEVFDDVGRVGQARLVFGTANDPAVRVEQVADHPSSPVIRLTVAAAVPKADRADWMVEKLGELGVAEFIPLATARSVVLPGGRNKHDRWVRIATEAAKQSRRAGVMRVGELTSVDDAIRSSSNDAGSALWCLSTELPDALPIHQAAGQLKSGAPLTAFVGPEGGWSEQELRQFSSADVRPVRLTGTVLRVETAAVATAAVVGCLAASGAPAPLDDPSGRG